MQTRTVSAFKPAVGLRPLLPPRPCSRRPLAAVCSAGKPEQDDKLQTLPQKWAVPLAAVIAGAMLTSAAVPEEALAARSSGRVGGSSFSSARQSRPSPSRSGGGGGGGGGGQAARSGPVYRGGPTYNTYVAPPVYGGYGYGGGFSLFPTFVSPVFGFGGFFNLIIAMIALSLVFNVIKSVASSGRGGRNDEWDD